MATQTFHDYTGDGSDLTFDYSFPTFAVTDVVVELDGVIVDNYTIPSYATSGTKTVTFDNTTGTLNSTYCESSGAPKTGVAVRVYRDTGVDTAKATYAAGSSVKAGDLNDNQTQVLRALQEEQNQTITTTKLKDGAITSAKILDGTIVDADVNASAAIAQTKIALDADLTTLSSMQTGAAAKVALLTATEVETLDGITASTAELNILDGVTSTAAELNILDGVTSTTAELNILDGVTSTAAELNILDGVTSTTAELNILDGVTATTAELNIMDGVTATTAELNYTDGVTSNIQTQLDAKVPAGTDGGVDIGDSSTVRIGTGDDLLLYHDASTGHSWIKETGTNELKIASTPQVGIINADATKTAATFNTDGGGVKLFHDNAAKFETTSIGATVTGKTTTTTLNIGGTDITANGTELNRLDGITSTTAELNYVDGVTSNVQTQLDAKQPLDADLTTLAGMQSGTASVLADSTALTATTAELNLLDGKSIVTTIGASPTDVQIPTAQAVDERITTVVTDVGGFRPIANETSFPATNPDPDDDAGTIVSVKALASNLTSNGSGVATIANGAGSGNTVTINGMANSDTIEAGKGILVETTSTLHTYTFHRETLAPADITAAQSAVTDFNQRYQVASSTPSNQPDGTALAEGDLFFDTTANKMKVYDGSNYGEVTSTGDFKYLFLCPAGGSGAPTLTNTTFDLREGSNSGSAASVTNAAQLIVSVNGVIQKANTGTSAPAEGFAMVDANTIIFSAAPGAGASIFIHQAGSAVSIPTPGDDTVSTVKIQNLAVTTGKIADQAVALTKLPHGDGSSNGKFLRSNNGADPTWETVSTTPEGTAILSTGESGGTKFLREDGDGTSSWQTVVGAVADNCIYENDQTISNNYTIASGKGAHSVGPITVNATVTVNGNWVVS